MTTHACRCPPSFIITRFRQLYDYERDCNSKTLAMLESVPQANRASPEFGRAVGKMAHLVAARHFWLARLGECADRPLSWFPPTPLDQLPAAVAQIEQRWTAYLAKLTDADVLAECDLTAEDGSRWRWKLIDLLTQLFGHAWYHRGQIATLVGSGGGGVGGKTVNTDFIFWEGGPKRVEA